MLKAYKFRLYPTKEQIVKLNMHFGHKRSDKYTKPKNNEIQAGTAGSQACEERVRPANSEAMCYEAGSPVYTTG
ncbi:MAG: helix-turn-helix domain-containing protein [Thermotogae bacterium]|jgi:transposase|nr:helix-turn-helix domain-containing protein [Thermotogota bacterium]MCL5032621.1 helix-turn-helix domain-containing protein [Thermotogota bacterium]